MKKSPGRSHTPVRLSASLNQHLNFYALAASAAGVSLLALAEPSEAKIIYTKTHKIIRTDDTYPLHLTHDGTIDFLIHEYGLPFSTSGNNALGVKEAYGNAVEGSKGLASALNKGAPIGPRQRFISSTSTFGEVMFAAQCIYDEGCSTVGQWKNVKNRYLGLKFQIDEKTHYGWARLNVVVQPDDNITATLTGYAYETIPNKGIRAGQTVSEGNALAAHPNLTARAGSKSPVTAAGTAARTSLGRLALGAKTASSRRRP